MREFIANFSPTLNRVILEDSRTINRLWRESNFTEAEEILQRQYDLIREDEERLPDTRKYHKGATLFNLGIALVSQNDPSKGPLGVLKLILAYIEDLLNQDSIGIANSLPAARTLSDHFPETTQLMHEVEISVKNRLHTQNIPKDPEEILNDIDVVIRENTLETYEATIIEDRPDNVEEARSKVFVVHGRNRAAKDAMYEFLFSVGLEPLDWDDLIEETGNPSPYIWDILETGFRIAQAFVVLMTPDDKARLREELCREGVSIEESTLTYQPRQNVLFEAGMAMFGHRRRTILVELGDMHLLSDIEGIHTVRLNNSEERRRGLGMRLRLAGCSVNLTGNEWLRAGDFNEAINFSDY